MAVAPLVQLLLGEQGVQASMQQQQQQQLQMRVRLLQSVVAAVCLSIQCALAGCPSAWSTNHPQTKR